MAGSNDNYPKRWEIREYWMPWLSKWKGISGNTNCCFACGIVPRGNRDDDEYEDYLVRLGHRGRVGKLTLSWLEVDLRGTSRLELHRAHLVPRWKEGPDTVQNLWLLCHYCHEESENLGVREKFRWLLRMSRDIRHYHNFFRIGGLPSLMAYMEERQQPFPAFCADLKEEFPGECGLTKEDGYKLVNDALEKLLSRFHLAPPCNGFPIDIDLAVEEGMALYQSGQAPENTP